MGNLDTRGPLHPGPPVVADNGDAEWAEYTAWLDRESAAGRDPQPGRWAYGDTEPWDPEPEPEPEETDFTGPLFAADADGLPPGPALAALTEQAVSDVTGLSDAELVGVLRATQRQMAREQYKQMLAAAEFGRRRQAAFDDALRRGVPAGCAPGGFPGEELSIELTVSRAEAAHLIDDAIDLTSRLPRTLAGMAAGLVDAGRAGWIAMYTRDLAAADTARADETLAAAAPELRTEQLARKAAALEMKLNPAGVKARRERARRDHQRVEARREASGNASLAGRELDVADVLASKAYLDALASRLRASGLDGSLDRLRALALTDLTQGRDPLDRIQTQPDQAAPAGPPPVPALVNLLIPAGTLLGLSTAPAEAGSWGLLDAADTRAIAAAAAAHPQTRWCVTLTGQDGTALAHGCARGPRPGLLEYPQTPPTQKTPQTLQTHPPPSPLAELLRRLNLSLTPITRGTCDHAAAEGHYTPSRTLRHLVRARNAICDAPGCQNVAATTDLDHTVPWPGGPTDQCNLAPRCRTHHRAKQAPDWTVEQSAPGITRWTLPSGRTHITTPTTYET